MPGHDKYISLFSDRILEPLLFHSVFYRLHHGVIIVPCEIEEKAES